MPIPNKSIIDSLTETIKQKVDPAKLYDILQKVNQNISKIYDTLFIGPLPSVSGENLDLTALPRTELPVGIAFVDVANIFTENQAVIRTNQPTWRLLTTSSVTAGRMINVTSGQTLFSHGMYYDGTNWVADNGATGAGLLVNSAGTIQLLQMVAGVLNVPIVIAADKVIRIGTIGTATGAAADEIVIPNLKALKASNVAATGTLPIAIIDGFDLVQIGSKSAGNTNPNGAPAIPTVAAADLPAAGANNNGMILIDKTNHRICWWDSGNRYYAAGTAF
jgi:hypothetical protein